MIRLAAGILLGYALFVFAAVLIFSLSGRDPHAPAEPAFMVGSIGAGVIAALAGGYLGAAVAKGSERGAGLVIAIIIAIIASISLLAQPGDARWSQLAALLLMSPTAFLGSVIRSRRVRVR
ncbi:MAG TPA: hypothetical protein VEK56_15860 [Vicinamibacterales bacterium]|nr:hypothetical protein [Vicinamibacterales bacterium]